jgi:hypothetical protein
LEVVILSGTLNAINLMFGSLAGSAGFIIVYYVLFILAQIFSTAMQVDAWVSKNTMQVVAVALFNIFTCVYSVVQVLHLQRVKNCGMEYIDSSGRYREYSDPSVRYRALQMAYRLTELSSSGDCPKTDAFIADGPGGIFHHNGQDILVQNSVSNMAEGSRRIQQGIDIISGLIPIAAVISGLCILYSIVGIFTSIKVYQEYGWRLFQKNGASLLKRKLLKRYHLFILFLKLDVFFACGIITQMIGALYYYNKQSGLDKDPKTAVSKGFVISACAIMCIVAIFYYTVGWFAVKRSNYYLMSGFLILMIVQAIALCFAIVIASSEPAFRLTLIWLTSFGNI